MEAAATYINERSTQALAEKLNAVKDAGVSYQSIATETSVNRSYISVLVCRRADRRAPRRGIRPP